jgi:hypothetical protein
MNTSHMNGCHSDLHFKLVYEPGSDNGWNYLGVNIGIRATCIADLKGGRDFSKSVEGALKAQC